VEEERERGDGGALHQRDPAGPGGGHHEHERGARGLPFRPPLRPPPGHHGPGGRARLGGAARLQPRVLGVRQFSLSLLLGRPIAKRGFLQLGTGLGYRYLSITRKGAKTTAGGANAAADLWSYPFLASADLGLWLTPSLLLGARYSGLMTLSHGDLYPERTRHLAGPVLVWRVDDRLDLTAGSWSTAKASNTLHYDQVYVALTFKQTRLNRLQGFLGGTKAP
jgi:hypothetical protein